MNYKIRLSIDELDNMYRIINVNDNITIQMFIKTLIVSMNGDSKVLHHLYKMKKNNNILIEYGNNELLSTLKLKVNDTYQISYEDKNTWILCLEVLEINNNLKTQSIEVTETKGNGICLSEDAIKIKCLMTTNNLKWRNNYINYSKTLKNYFNASYTVDDINRKIYDYLYSYQDIHTPKTFVMNISLEGFTKEIKRKVLVNDNILIDKFCRCVIVSMNGDLDHLYAVKLGKYCYDENILDKKIDFLELTKGQKFKVIYDYGDNWKFNVSVSKVIEGHQEKTFTIDSGYGYGIVEDCGGIYELGNIFSGNSEYFDKIDINEFDLKELQKNVDEELKIEDAHQERMEAILYE